jgi:hypothetical protein
VSFGRVFKSFNHNFHIPTLRLDTIEVHYSPPNAQVIVLKSVLKFTLKYLRLFFGIVTPSSGRALFVLTKVTLVKIVKWCVINSVVMWLHILVDPCWCVYVAPLGSVEDNLM